VASAINNVATVNGHTGTYTAGAHVVMQKRENFRALEKTCKSCITMLFFHNDCTAGIF